MHPRVLLVVALAVPLAGCSAVRSVRWPWASSGSPAAAPPAPVAPRAPAEPAPPPPADLGPVVAAPPPNVPPPSTLPPVTLDPEHLEPPDDEAPVPPTAPPRAVLPAMPDGPRVPWSAATDPDLPALPASVAVTTARPWTVIVLHHSATKRGSSTLFDKMHREKGWDGVGYDFVIGNGTDTGDGELEVTYRWRDQKDGSHAKGWNDVAIGICLVGNYEEGPPTPAQRDTLVRLLRHLRRRFGIPAERVVGHKALNPTLCPGKRFPLADVLTASAP
jgi:hypothetical protein